jgi:CheY-like chemotaxis protein
MQPARILYVEDDDDIRDTMTMLLEHEGYAVTCVQNAEDALRVLGRDRFDLLLTDYQLPAGNADWLIDTATERGHLGATPVIVLSGAHDPHGVEGHRLIRKPVSQEALFAAFDAVMPDRGTPAPAPAPAPAPRPIDADLRLVLYVSGASPASRKAQRNLDRVLRDVDPARVELVVHDIAGGGRDWASAAEEDRVVVTPTLVRRAPLPKVWIAGDLSSVDVVRDAVIPPLMLRR